MRMSSALLLAGLSLAPAAAFAQKDDGKPVRTTFIDMDAMYLEGRHAKPLGDLIQARKAPKFDSLVRLKRDVLPGLKASAHDVSLR